MSIRAYRSYISLLIGFFLLVGNFNAQVWSFCSAYGNESINLVCSSQVSEENDIPVFPPIFPINAESESDEEISEEEIDDSDSAFLNQYFNYLTSGSYLDQFIEGNKRLVFLELPRYVLFHCWKSNCQ